MDRKQIKAVIKVKQKSCVFFFCLNDLKIGEFQVNWFILGNSMTFQTFDTLTRRDTENLWKLSQILNLTQA